MIFGYPKNGKLRPFTKDRHCEISVPWGYWYGPVLQKFEKISEKFKFELPI